MKVLSGLESELKWIDGNPHYYECDIHREFVKANIRARYEVADAKHRMDSAGENLYLYRWQRGGDTLDDFRDDSRDWYEYLGWDSRHPPQWELFDESYELRPGIDRSAMLDWAIDHWVSEDIVETLYSEGFRLHRITVRDWSVLTYDVSGQTSLTQDDVVDIEIVSEIEMGEIYSRSNRDTINEIMGDYDWRKIRTYTGPRGQYIVPICYIVRGLSSPSLYEYIEKTTRNFRKS